MKTRVWTEIFWILVIVRIWITKFRLWINFWFWKTILLKNISFCLKRSKTKPLSKNPKRYIFGFWPPKNSSTQDFFLFFSLLSLSLSLPLPNLSLLSFLFLSFSSFFPFTPFFSSFRPAQIRPSLGNRRRTQVRWTQGRGALRHATPRLVQRPGVRGSKRAAPFYYFFGKNRFLFLKRGHCMSEGEDSHPNVIKDVRENKTALWSELRTECSKGKKYSCVLSLGI